MIEIKHRYTDEILFRADVDSLKLAVEVAVKSRVDLGGAYLSDTDLRDADLRGAYLCYADLSDTDLRGADLRGAYLCDAYLSGTHLSGAYLSAADLRGAYLSAADLCDADLRDAYFGGAVLSGADLRGADLGGADLRGADLCDADLRYAYLGGVRDMRLETGERLSEYIEEVVRPLITAGGRSVEEVAAAWDSHTWGNCPMSIAFGAKRLAEVPILYRPRAEQFVRLFDAGLIPRPVPTA
jgi:hypothetical protein